jgi:hypothetical protein
MVENEFNCLACRTVEHSNSLFIILHLPTIVLFILDLGLQSVKYYVVNGINIDSIIIIRLFRIIA